MISLTFLVGSIGRTFFWIRFFLIYFHLSYNYYEVDFFSKGLLIVYGLRYCLCYVVQFKYFIHKTEQ